MKLAAIFTDHMVFAAHKPIRVFGTAEGILRAEMNGKTAEVAAHGDFLLTLPAMDYGGPYTLTLTGAEEKITLSDILIGDVYLCSGQSNMELTLAETVAPKEEYLSLPDVRYYNATYLTPWEAATPDTVGKWSAIGYLVAKERTRRTSHPVGLVCLAQGASVIESWLPEALTKTGVFHLKDEDKFYDHFKEEYASWNGNGVLYTERFLPLAPFSFTHAFWYQGESDCTLGEAAVYDRMLAAMINTWRRDLRDAMLPFVIIQIAAFPDYEGQIWWTRETWGAIQNAQARAAEAIPHTRLVVSEDISTPEIHPADKGPLALRIADLL